MSAFTVTSARLSANERTLHVTYRETDDERLLTTQVEARGFEHWLQCQHGVDCPTLIEWILASPRADIHARAAAYLEFLMDGHYNDLITCQTEAA